MGEAEAAERWLARAAAAAQAAPTPLRARQLETWRGIARAAAGDSRAMRDHLERAVRLAGEQGRPAGRCEALARLALEAARLGARQGDAELLDLAERSAADAKALCGVLPGHPPWGAQADAALTQVHLARGEVEVAVDAARRATAALHAALSEDVHLEILPPVARALLAGGQDAEKAAIRQHLQTVLAGIAQRTLDQDVRVRWFRARSVES
jgi:hypothetical protein